MLNWLADLCTCSLDWTQLCRSNRHRFNAASYQRGRRWGESRLLCFVYFHLCRSLVFRTSAATYTHVQTQTCASSPSAVQTLLQSAGTCRKGHCCCQRNRPACIKETSGPGRLQWEDSVICFYRCYFNNMWLQWFYFHENTNYYNFLIRMYFFVHFRVKWKLIM